MGLASLLWNNPLAFVLLVFPLLYSVIAHEVAHGVVALWFGDDTAKRQGRLTLKPLPHIDPVGAVMLFLVGFGWAKPVPVDYRYLRNSRVGMICVALAGVVVNILLAAAALVTLESPIATSRPVFKTLLSVMAHINLVLAAFNLIPIPPLDGSRVVMGLLPENKWNAFAKLEPFGFGFLILLIVTGFLTPVIFYIRGLVYSLIHFVFGV